MHSPYFCVKVFCVWFHQDATHMLCINNFFCVFLSSDELKMMMKPAGKKRKNDFDLDPSESKKKRKG